MTLSTITCRIAGHKWVFFWPMALWSNQLQCQCLRCHKRARAT